MMPETIELTGTHLLYAYGAIHVLYALAIHYKWVYGVRSQIGERVAENKNRQLKQPSYVAPDPHFCKKCMVKQFIPLMTCGLEFKIVQTIAYGVLWIAQVLLGGGFSSPFKLRLHKDVDLSFWPRCRCGRNYY